MVMGLVGDKSGPSGPDGDCGCCWEGTAFGAVGPIFRFVADHLCDSWAAVLSKPVC